MQKKGRKAEAGRVEKDEILPEYDFSDARPNKYAARYAAGSTVVVLEPDVATVFPSAGEVNEGLRALGKSEAVVEAANMPIGMSASQVFVFGSLVTGELRPDSDIDMAVSSLPAKLYFSAVGRAGRPVDTALVRHLLGSHERIRVR